MHYSRFAIVVVLLYLSGLELEPVAVVLPASEIIQLKLPRLHRSLRLLPHFRRSPHQRHRGENLLRLLVPLDLVGKIE